ncbi:energy transducer TonB [Luteirhabdus pelagi]|uniref:energy transducer TonB n=1 Tax=Luteirhabdus pelagi TaxID=2792783 RepID=UPI00193ADB6D|nr:energy transducer TonB [Luteirhabdus pelagi]
MKKLIFILSLLITTAGVAQEEWGDMQKNKLTMKELAPIWPGCENGSAPQRDNCFKQKLAQHIAKNFKYPADAYKNNVQGRVVVTFIIDENGKPVIKNVSGGTEVLQKEAQRNIMSIPQMAKPGMMGGKPRAIEYTVPITFKTGK